MRLSITRELCNWISQSQQFLWDGISPAPVEVCRVRQATMSVCTHLLVPGPPKVVPWDTASLLRFTYFFDVLSEQLLQNYSSIHPVSMMPTSHHFHSHEGFQPQPESNEWLYMVKYLSVRFVHSCDWGVSPFSGEQDDIRDERRPVGNQWGIWRGVVGDVPRSKKGSYLQFSKLTGLAW